MTVRELYEKISDRIPEDLREDWDNDGIMCCADDCKEVGRALITLDVTARAVEYAIDGGYDCIVAHHPFIFKGLKSLDEEGEISSKVMRLICSGISAMSFHTRLDAVEGGVNDTLCALLGLSDVASFEEEGIPLGRVGELEKEMSAEELARLVKEKLCAPFVLLSDTGRAAKRVAVLGGSGKDVIEAARATGADTFVSGRLDYHPMTDGAERISSPMNLIEAGHFYTEQPVCEVLKRMIESIDGNICCHIYSSNVIKAI